MDSSQQHAEDIEAMPHQSEDSAAAEEQQSHSYFHRRKKAVAAVVSLVAVAAIAAGVGIAVSGKSNKPAEPEQSAAGVSQSNQGINIANDILEEVSPSAETPEFEQFEPQDQEVVIVVLDPDDESQDIISEMGYDAEHPDDIIYDAGWERPKPQELDLATESESEEGAIPTEEKVPFNSEDMAVELSDFNGPLSEFIVAKDLARISTSQNGKCKSGEALLSLELNSDNYPWETSWILEDKAGTALASGPPVNTNYARLTKYQGRICMAPGRYNIILRDRSADGICCSYGEGSLKARVNGKMVAQTNDQPFVQRKWGFIIQPSQQNQPTTNPTPNPTPKPNPANNPKPTSQPTPPSLNPASELYPVDIKVVTDKFAGETGYRFVDIATNEVLVNKPRGSLQKLKTYENNLLLEPGRYRLEMDDGFKGIESPGSYSVSVDGDEVMYGTTWNTKDSEKNNYVIRVGYTPPMSDRDKEWLDGHNQRREDYHTSQGVKYNPMVWSPDLAEAAKNWVQEITPSCKLQREPNLIEGENMSARTSNGPRDEGPEAIMTRWADNKVKFGLGYPENQSMTQMLWRATRYVGCHDETVTLERNGRDVLCYVSICRYSRAGNCAMGQFNAKVDWATPTLADRSQCGPSCARNVCY